MSETFSLDALVKSAKHKTGKSMKVVRQGFKGIMGFFTFE